MIRKFELGDIEQIMTIWLVTNQRAHNFISVSYWEGNYEMVKETMRAAKTLGIEIWVAEEEGNIKGFIGLHKGYIEGLFVSEEMQGCGIGSKLIEQVKSVNDKLSLKVYKKNLRAIRFYNKQGFKVVGEGKDKETNELELVME